MEQGSRVHGRVLDQAGKPVAGAEVTDFGGDYDAWERSVQTDSEGRFTLPTCEEREMPQLLARKGNLISQWLKSDKLVDDFGEITLILRPAGAIKGQIVTQQGDPIGWPYACDISLTLEDSYVSPSKRGETACCRDKGDPTLWCALIGGPSGLSHILPGPCIGHPRVL